MDVITLAMLNSMKKNGAVGSVESGKKLITMELTDGRYLDDTRTESVFEIGKTYTITVDGVDYTVKSLEGSAFDVDVMLGNLGVLGGTDTGEPFIIYEAFDNGDDNVWVLAAAVNNGATSITVSTPETVHTIDPKYLPEGIGGSESGSVVLPVLDLTKVDFWAYSYNEEFNMPNDELDALTSILDKMENDGKFTPIVVQVDCGQFCTVLCDFTRNTVGKYKIEGTATDGVELFVVKINYANGSALMSYNYDAVASSDTGNAGGLPVVDFGTLPYSEDMQFLTELNDFQLTDPCFLGKMNLTGDVDGSATPIYMVFTDFAGVYWNGYTRTHSAFGGFEVVGTAQNAGSGVVLAVEMFAQTEETA